jgi:hypothetical protein
MHKRRRTVWGWYKKQMMSEMDLIGNHAREALKMILIS